MAERVDQLLLVHVGPPLYADLLGLVVEVVLRPILVIPRLAAAPGGLLAGRVGDPRGLFLARALAAQRLVALVVLDLRSVLLGHGFHPFGCLWLANIAGRSRVPAAQDRKSTRLNSSH